MDNKGEGECVLPPEIWEEEIYKRLVLSDRIRFSSVLRISRSPYCPSFLPETWLLFGTSTSLRKNRFHCFPDKKVYKFANIIPEHSHVLGSSNGWLLTHIPLTDQFDLVNPIINAQIRIAKATYIFDTNIYKLIVVEMQPTLGESTIIVLTSPAILTVYNNGIYHIQKSRTAYVDIVFYNGRIHGLVTEEGVFKVHVLKMDTVFERLYKVRGIAKRSHPYLIREYDKEYLVESGGDLLIVRERKSMDSYQTVGYEVFKLVIHNGFADAVKLQSLGDQEALFVGSDGCISLAVGEFSPFEVDRVYFHYFVTHCSSPTLCKVLGMSLKDGSIKQFFGNLPMEICLTNSFWFVPTTEDINKHKD